MWDSQWDLAGKSVLQANQWELTAVLRFPPVSYMIQNFSKPIPLLATSFKLVPCLAYSLALKTEVTCSSENIC
jgi:hypothetical protein